MYYTEGAEEEVGERDEIHTVSLGIKERNEITFPKLCQGVWMEVGSKDESRGCGKLCRDIYPVI